MTKRQNGGSSSGLIRGPPWFGNDKATLLYSVVMTECLNLSGICCMDHTLWSYPIHTRMILFAMNLMVLSTYVFNHCQELVILVQVLQYAKSNIILFIWLWGQVILIQILRRAGDTTTTTICSHQSSFRAETTVFPAASIEAFIGPNWTATSKNIFLYRRLGQSSLDAAGQSHMLRLGEG
jgi:hypothetical protein